MRVPVIHKFGIVSVSRAEQLLREGREDGRGSKKKHARWEGLLAAAVVVHTMPSCRSTKASAPIKISQSFITKVGYTRFTVCKSTRIHTRGTILSTVQQHSRSRERKTGQHPTSDDLTSQGKIYQTVDIYNDIYRCGAN